MSFQHRSFCPLATVLHAFLSCNYPGEAKPGTCSMQTLHLIAFSLTTLVVAEIPDVLSSPSFSLGTINKVSP